MNNKAYHPKTKLLSNLKKHIINKVTLLVFSFFIFTTTTFAQTTDVYTTTGSWTVPVGVTSVTVEIWGAGGGGGGSNTSSSGGSGGGSGSYVTRVIPVVSGTYNFTIGTGGAGGAANGGNGGNGGNSSTLVAGFTLTAGGGNGGNGNAGAIGPGSTTATGGTTNTFGNDGALGGASGGKGGNSPFGGNGGAGATDGAGSAGGTPGAGGGGGEKSNKNKAGGAGARGEIRFTYVIAGSYCAIGTTSSTYWISKFSTNRRRTFKH